MIKLLRKIFNSIILSFKILWMEFLISLVIILIFIFFAVKLNIVCFCLFFSNMFLLCIFGLTYYSNSLKFLKCFLLIQAISLFIASLICIVSLFSVEYSKGLYLTFSNLLQISVEVPFQAFLLKEDMALLIFKLILIIIKSMYCFLFSLLFFFLFKKSKILFLTNDTKIIFLCSISWLAFLVVIHFTGFFTMLHILIDGSFPRSENLLIAFFLVTTATLIILIFLVCFLLSFGLFSFNIITKMYSLIILNIIFSFFILSLDSIWSGIFLPLIALGFPLIEFIYPFLLLEFSIFPTAFSMEDGKGNPVSYTDWVKKLVSSVVVDEVARACSLPNTNVRLGIECIKKTLPTPELRSQYTDFVSLQQKIAKSSIVFNVENIQISKGSMTEDQRTLSKSELKKTLTDSANTRLLLTQKIPHCSSQMRDILSQTGNAIAISAVDNIIVAAEVASNIKGKSSSDIDNIDLIKGSFDSFVSTQTFKENSSKMVDAYIRCTKVVPQNKPTFIASHVDTSTQNIPLTFCQKAFSRSPSTWTPEELARCSAAATKK